MGRLEGKVALVTGAARGQGRSHAVTLAREGADVIAVDIARELPEFGLTYPLGSAEELAETAAQVEKLDRRVITGEIDVRDTDLLTDFVSEAVAELGRLDVVIANAGIAGPGAPTHEITDLAWDQLVSVNLTGAWATTKATIPHLIEGGRGGSVVLISSMAGLRGYPGIGAYSAAKHGVVGLMRTLAAELAPRWIRVNSIHPTQVDTPMIHNDGTYRKFRPDLENPARRSSRRHRRRCTRSRLPGRTRRTSATHAVLFLASDDSRLITGVTLPVDAGLLIE